MLACEHWAGAPREGTERMAVTRETFRAGEERAARRVSRLPFGLSWTALALLGIVALAAALRFGNSGAIGQANTYYTAAVEAMLQSWHNFFFVSAEPGGSVSVDKPPVGLWLQAISAYFLGVNGFAVVLPQILAGIGSVLVLFHLVRRSFGSVAGLLAALALAVTPVAIAVERNNTPDATLIFTLLLAAWAFLKAAEAKRLRFLILGAVLVGIGFNIKMMQALLPLPAFYAMYLFGSEQRWWKKILHLGLATAVLVPVALSWAIAVDMTPADQRPYVGSSSSNSEIDLMVGYNGLQRLLGNRSGWSWQSISQIFSRTSSGGATAGAAQPDGQSAPSAPGQMQPPSGQSGADGRQGRAGQGGFPGGGQGFPGGQGGPGGGGMGGGNMFGTGNPGVLRLFQSGLAAQVSWMLPFGLIALAAMATAAWRRDQIVLRRGVILWGGWLLTCVVFFSVAGFFHQYYLAMLGAPLAAVVAIGAVWMWRLYRQSGRLAAALLAGAAAVTLAYQVYAVNMYGSLSWWVVPAVALAALGAVLLVAGLFVDGRRLPQAAFALIVLGLLVIPGVWSGLTTAYANTSGAMTQAYSGQSGQGGPGGMGRDGGRRDGAWSSGQQPSAPTQGDAAQSGGKQSLVAYLQERTQDVKYLLVVPSSQAGAEYVLQTGRPVLYAGGFSGSDPVIDAEGLAKLVAQGDVRYVLWGGDRGGPGGGSSGITSYLQSSCTVVTDANVDISGARGGPGGGASTLYACGVS
ncbi:glycosyltransferase family 39 protein [Chloroflexia bacterium SDU3-3]|nr:glycosyltransferase family 39 protein [Chloroflexia bacterium SDU3-3]